MSKTMSPEMVKLFRGASHRTSGSHCSHSATAWTFTGSICLLESGMESHSLVSIFLIRKDSYWFVSISSYVVSLFLFTLTFVIYLFNKQICIQCGIYMQHYERKNKSHNLHFNGLHSLTGKAHKQMSKNIMKHGRKYLQTSIQNIQITVKTQ